MEYLGSTIELRHKIRPFQGLYLRQKRFLCIPLLTAQLTVPDARALKMLRTQASGRTGCVADPLGSCGIGRAVCAVQTRMDGS